MSSSHPTQHGAGKLAMGLAVSLTILVLADWKLRRVEKVDEQIVTGQTGFSWVDEVLAQRAARQIELKKLASDVDEAKTAPQRIAARYAIAAYESKQGQPDSRRAIAAFRAVIAEGGETAQTLDARRQLIGISQSNEDSAESTRLLIPYADIVRRLPLSPSKLSSLLDVWRLGTELNQDDIVCRALEVIHHEYPLSPEALQAYEELERINKSRNNSVAAAAVHETILKTRDLMKQQDDEQLRYQSLGAQIREKDAAHADETLAAMTPGLLSMIDYWSLYAQVIALYEAQGKTDDVRRLIMKAGSVFDLEKIPPAQRTSFLTSLAQGQMAAGQFAEAAATLAKLPEKDAAMPWTLHLRAKLWLASRQGDSAVPVARALSVGTLPAITADKSDANWNAMLPAVNAATPSTYPETRWRAYSSGGALCVQVDCTEPEPEKMRIAQTKADSAVWEDDSIEIFTASVKDDSAYNGVMVNSKGVLLDVRSTSGKPTIPPIYAENMAWSSGATAKTEKTATGWRVNISIPWKNLNINPSDGACFLAIRRQRYVTGTREPSSWTVPALTVQDPSSMGVLIFK